MAATMNATIRSRMEKARASIQVHLACYSPSFFEERVIVSSSPTRVPAGGLPHDRPVSIEDQHPTLASRILLIEAVKTLCLKSVLRKLMASQLRSGSVILPPPPPESPEPPPPPESTPASEPPSPPEPGSVTVSVVVTVSGGLGGVATAVAATACNRD